jgi:hypothetical protein
MSNTYIRPESINHIVMFPFRVHDTNQYKYFDQRKIQKYILFGLIKKTIECDAGWYRADNIYSDIYSEADVHDTHPNCTIIDNILYRNPIVTIYCKDGSEIQKSFTKNQDATNFVDDMTRNNAFLKIISD